MPELLCILYAFPYLIPQPAPLQRKGQPFLNFEAVRTNMADHLSVTTTGSCKH